MTCEACQVRVYTICMCTFARVRACVLRVRCGALARVHVHACVCVGVGARASVFIRSVDHSVLACVRVREGLCAYLRVCVRVLTRVVTLLRAREFALTHACACLRGFVSACVFVGKLRVWRCLGSAAVWGFMAGTGLCTLHAHCTLIARFIARLLHA